MQRLSRVPFACLTPLLTALLTCVANAEPATATPPATRSAATLPFTLVSPSDVTRVTVDLDDRGRPGISVERGGKSILARSTLGLEFDGSGPLRDGLRLLSASRDAFDETYEMPVPTKASHLRDHYDQLTVELEEAVGAHRRLNVILRAYDDGIAFRYAIPDQPSMSTFILTDELTELRLAANPLAHALPLKNYVTPYEGYYVAMRAGALPAGGLIGMPLLLEFDDGPAVAITEAALTDYAGMYLMPTARASADSPAEFRSALTPLLGQKRFKVRGVAPFESPWRVVMIADSAAKLIESTLVLNLNPPSKIADPSWIKPGKVAFPWWNGYVVPADAGFKGDVNTQTLKYYIDFCAENGIEFASIDGNDEAWYGGPNTPWLGADVTKARADLDLPAVLAYAKQRGVRIRLWMHWAGLQARLDEALATYERWGIDGIMIDFMDRDDQEMVRFYHEVAAKAAAHHLTVNYHGAYKPAGMERTWPNVMNYEAALNLEYNKWTGEQSRGSPPAHELTLPFTRMLAGPMDFHSGGMRSVRPDEFDFRNLAPLVMGTRAHQLARYVVYENPLPMLADDPASYRGAAGFEFICGVPTTWDETRVLDGKVGDTLIIARRHGEHWWLGAMAGQSARTVVVPLSFLGEKAFDATLFADDLSPDAPATAVRKSSQRVDAKQSLTIQMTIAGGQAVHFAPAQP